MQVQIDLASQPRLCRRIMVSSVDGALEKRNWLSRAKIQRKVFLFPHFSNKTSPRLCQSLG
jgi:hypothetical protein